MGDTVARKKRDARLDVARGVAIVVIVLVHVFRGLHNGDMMGDHPVVLLELLVGPFALSVFAFVGGTFVARGVRQRGVGGYVRDRVAQLLFIFVLWTLLQGSVQLMAANAINIPPSIGSVLRLWVPLGHLWYLPFLILVTVVFVPTQPWAGRRAPWVLGVAAVISIAFWGYDGGYVGTQGLGLVVFFVAGMVIGGERVKAALDRFSPTVAGLVSIAVLAVGATLSVLTHATGPTVFWEVRTVATTAIGFVLSVVMSAALLLFGQAARSSSLLAFLGRRSLDIYLAHIILASGTRIALVYLGVTSTWVIVVACLLVGVAGSVLVGTVARRIGLGWVFDAPAWVTNWPRRARVGEARVSPRA
ncbi:acyltransferase [Mycolicibacterium sp. CR10]|uniref:acyltransferase family protein n=1 Tax=Mycolicibacterium sp. CR10 TaxID=2562314 RepID=UPI0010C0DC99|nr:acyltransferase [Mycolicibacterium sp. CR10]